MATSEDSASLAPEEVVHAGAEVGGQLIKAGERVAAFMGSANRDEAKFPDPDRFDITRPITGHLAFGHGIHFCLGAPLARLEARVALDALMERVASFRLAEGSAWSRWPPSWSWASAACRSR